MNDAAQDDDNLKDFDDETDSDGSEAEFDTSSNATSRPSNASSAQARHRIELYWERKRLAAELGEDDFGDFDDDE